MEARLHKIAPAVIEETENWLVVAKPAGWLSIPGRGDAQLPVLEEWASKKLGTKAWVVHRIDRETSGVVLFAKNAEAHRKANSWFEKHEVKKTYEFLAQGRPTTPLMRINLAIEGRPSVTQVEVKERFNEAFLGRAYPLSGRRHQIRIHLSQKGFPILGDREYGGPTQLTTPFLEVSRVALHAKKLELPTGETFEAPWPEDFKQWVDTLRGNLK